LAQSDIFNGQSQINGSENRFLTAVQDEFSNNVRSIHTERRSKKTRYDAKGDYERSLGSLESITTSSIYLQEMKR